ncbi:hypothetical protein BW247_06750 [Acidihalobacter ferrooxydans]|uniref:Uncharacterized protein n=1 Tax=Acidihalobacter ferrooxydans TaxID=1765967 RepID=A0A1P8UG46_9GAMM|nr:hypothetical protein BW247_06750 [Acidihalobacter ferrooxydans]
MPGECPGYGAKNKHGRWTVACVGEVSKYKGSRILAEMQMLILNHGWPIDLIIIGICSDKETKWIVPETGKYNPEELPEILYSHQVSAVTLPFIWPETFSYVTNELCAIGVPVVTFNIGAPAERIRNYEKGLIVKELTAKDMLIGIECLLRKHAQYPWSHPNNDY